MLCTMHLCECCCHLISDQHYVYESIYKSIIWQAFKYKHYNKRCPYMLSDFIGCSEWGLMKKQ